LSAPLGATHALDGARPIDAWLDVIPRLADPALIPRDFTTSEEVNEVYRRRARFFDWSVNAYYLIGFRWWAYRHRAVAALQLQPGATVVEIGCGTTAK